MIELTIERNGKDLSLVLPVSASILDGELRNIGIYEPMEQIPCTDFLLRPIDPLGEHFLQMVRREDTLRMVATASREFELFGSESRQVLTDLVMTDRLRDLDHMVEYLRYGPDALDGLMRLTRDGRSVLLPTSQINMYQCFGAETPMGLIRLAEMELTPVSELGRRLIAEFQPYSDTVAIANLACELVKIPAFAQSDLGKFMGGIRVFQMPMDTETMNYYCPLFVRQYDPDTEEYEAIDRIYLARNEDEIRMALQVWTDGKDRVEYLDDRLQPKIASLGWEIERIGGEVYGKAVCELRAPLTDSEQAELAQWLSFDTSDGLLDNFGEYPIKTDDGDLYVSFFRYDSETYMLSDDEFRAQVLEEQGQGMGGMGGMAG